MKPALETLYSLPQLVRGGKGILSATCLKLERSVAIKCLRKWRAKIVKLCVVLWAKKLHFILKILGIAYGWSSAQSSTTLIAHLFGTCNSHPANLDIFDC